MTVHHLMNSIGSWSSDRINGYGAFTKTDGSEYKGEWLDEMKHGFGLEYFAEDNATYEGHYEYNEKSGLGKYSWADDKIYIGEWRGDQMSG